jgi:hypothetical protein
MEHLASKGPLFMHYGLLPQFNVPCLYDLVCGPISSNPWDSFPMEAQARLVLPKLATKQGPAKQKGTPSKDLKSKIS